VADVGGGCGEPLLKGREIEGAATFVNLDGIASAEGDVRLGLAREVREIVAGAGATRWIAGDADGLEVA